MLLVKDYVAEQRVGNHAPLHATLQQPKQAKFQAKHANK